MGTEEEKSRLFLKIWSDTAHLASLKPKATEFSDWINIADKVNAELPDAEDLRFSPSSCMINYMHRVELPSRRFFSKEDLMALKKAVYRSGPFKWDELAERVGGKRSAFQCFVQYQRHVHTAADASWTASEDDRLRAICLEGAAPACWERVAARFGEGRSPRDCEERCAALVQTGDKELVDWMRPLVDQGWQRRRGVTQRSAKHPVPQKFEQDERIAQKSGNRLVRRRLHKKSAVGSQSAACVQSGSPSSKRWQRMARRRSRSRSQN